MRQTEKKKQIERNKQIEKKKLGIYIHIPFCEKKCAYCDFLSAPESSEVKKKYIDVLQKEIESFREQAKEYQVQTIFIGGGTPSSLEASSIALILQQIRSVFFIETEAEITIEVNPGTLKNKNGEDKLRVYQEIGINRLSIGLQSTNNKELQILGRIHTYEEFLENYLYARELGFQNINIDVMSALPGQTLESWEETISKIVALNPEHMSAYSLIIEEGTPFYETYHVIENKKMLPDEDTEREMYQRTKEILEAAGYQRYEISNYAKKGYESKHNISYWTGTEYIGFGLGASSLLQIKKQNQEEQRIRFRKKDTLKEYVQWMSLKESERKHKNLCQDIEYITRNQQMEEFMFLGLRCMEGIAVEEFKNRFGIAIEQIYGTQLEYLEKQKLIKKEYGRIQLTERGIDVSNQVFVTFLIDES